MKRRISITVLLLLVLLVGAGCDSRVTVNVSNVGGQIPAAGTQVTLYRDAGLRAPVDTKLVAAGSRAATFQVRRGIYFYRVSRPSSFPLQFEWWGDGSVNAGRERVTSTFQRYMPYLQDNIHTGTDNCIIGFKVVNPSTMTHKVFLSVLISPDDEIFKGTPTDVAAGTTSGLFVVDLQMNYEFKNPTSPVDIFYWLTHSPSNLATDQDSEFRRCSFGVPDL
jgi:hypothetical protein